MGDASLAQKKVLIVEDEPFIALDLAYAIELSGGEVVGPAPTIRTALMLIAENAIDAAILDVNLPDGEVGPVIDMLIAHDCPMVIHTGAGTSKEIKDRYPNLATYFKPTDSKILTQYLASRIRS